METSAQKCERYVEQLLPWGEKLVEVFQGKTYAVKQSWQRNGETITTAVPAAWFQHHRRIKTQEDFLPFTPRVAAQHLLGLGLNRHRHWEKFCVGVYPLCSGNVVHFVAADIDLHQEKNESDKDFADRRRIGFSALLTLSCNIPEVARQYGISAFIEISGGGAGIHVWIFFSEPVAASTARRLLWRVLCAAGVPEQLQELGNEGVKFDAIFPKQDEIKELMTGNLIFLPYFEFALRTKTDNVLPRSIFVDTDAITNSLQRSTILRPSQFFDILQRHTNAEVDQAMEALKTAGFVEDPLGTRVVKTKTQCSPGRNYGSFTSNTRGIDWRNYLDEKGIPYDETKEGVLRLVDACPSCGIASHGAWINAKSGWLNCFSDNCEAYVREGGMAPWRWPVLYGLQPPSNKKY